MLNYIVALLCLFPLANAEIKCTNTTTYQTPPTDYLFLVDSSPSMCNYQKAVASGLGSFVDNLNIKNINARFAVAKFGGAPSLIQSFSVYLF